MLFPQPLSLEFSARQKTSELERELGSVSLPQLPFLELCLTCKSHSEEILEI